jgi:basic membrane protein A and related proteins
VYLSGLSSSLSALTVLGLAAVFATLSSCSPSASPAPEPGSQAKKLKVGIVFDTGGRGDKSFNDSAWRGLQKAEKELGIEVLAVDSKSVKDYETNLSGAAEQGADLVVAVGINMQSAVERVSADMPDAKFAIIDAVVDKDNVRSLLFTEHEGSFLVGCLAGQMTKTGKLGFIGGQELDLIKKFETGFAAGAMTVNPKVEILPAKYTGSWDDIDKARGAAKILYGMGADVIYHAAGRAGLGLIREAKAQGKFAIGVDSDQDSIEPGSVLTSMIKRVDEAVFQTIKDLKDGKFQAGTKVYDLKANGVGISDLTHTKTLIGEKNLAALEELKAKIISGEIKVPQTPAELETYLKTTRS